VLRSGSKPAAVVTLLLDAAKGWLPVALVAWYGKAWGLAEGTMAMAGLAAFVGHLFPVFFRFQGGKGVATALGVLFGIHWGLGLATAASWLIIAWFFRYSSLASLVAALFAPLYYIFGDGVAWYDGQEHPAGNRRDGVAAGLAPCAEHQPAGQGHRVPAGRQEGRLTGAQDCCAA
jgi:glycerol-3-phosphate acyltransferase PlsY